MFNNLVEIIEKNEKKSEIKKLIKIIVIGIERFFLKKFNKKNLEIISLVANL
jgi:hypothetical protein